jgi:hypothetical protein
VPWFGLMTKLKADHQKVGILKRKKDWGYLKDT